MRSKRCLSQEVILTDRGRPVGKIVPIHAIEQGIWRRINAVPDWTIVSGLAQRTTLRGADLWYLGLAVTLRRDLPELRMLTFDAKLQEAARREDLAILRP